jgi:RNA polymerase sigma-70 factor (ECF subfamily)
MDAESRIEKYLQRLYEFAFNLTRDPHQAEDLVQDCALRALSSANTPVDEPAFRAWLFRFLENAFLDRLRREKIASAAMEDVNFSPDVEFWQGEERFITALTVKIEMAKLPLSQREILTLIDISGFSYAEATKTLGIPTGTVGHL